MMTNDEQQLIIDAYRNKACVDELIYGGAMEKVTTEPHPLNATIYWTDWERPRVPKYEPTLEWSGYNLNHKVRYKIKDGEWKEDQLWCFMAEYGKHCSLGFDQPIETVIYFEDENLV